ncbi:hypothetical protein C1H46_040669 [Malus baccata]|uniref:Uncharacterized protein n=1 Tax=Malus baccata TaxID=106549 RepID=A0A540KIF3_MALBA|nr:hypothetical protein C1H46_040669 [Malus baccata]
MMGFLLSRIFVFLTLTLVGSHAAALPLPAPTLLELRPPKHTNAEISHPIRKLPGLGVNMKPLPLPRVNFLQ